MKLPVLLLAVLGVAIAALAASSPDARFSLSLTAQERTEAGLDKLSSDQVAVVDALVRRDLAKQLATSDEKPGAAKLFSARLSADERGTAGLGTLNNDQLSRLNGLVDRFESASRVRALLAPPEFVRAGPRPRVTENNAAGKPEVHGSFSLGMGWGKGGYSERTGSMNLNYTDPVRGFSVSVGYSETHVKGPGTYIYRDPVWTPPPVEP